MKKRQGKTIVCICGKNFYVPDYRKETAKFCSRECQNHKQYERLKITCYECKKEFTDSPSRKKRKFCSLECSEINQRDRNFDASKKRRDRIAQLRKKGYRPNEGPAVRKYALRNMPNNCLVCGYKEYLCCLDIHHIDDNPSNNDLENLAILCVMCHRKVHRNIIKVKK